MYTAYLDGLQLTFLQGLKSSIVKYTHYCTLSPSQDEEVIQLPRDPASGSVDLIDFENPSDLMLELLKQSGGSATVSKLTKVCGGRLCGGGGLPPSPSSLKCVGGGSATVSKLTTVCGGRLCVRGLPPSPSSLRCVGGSLREQP